MVTPTLGPPYCVGKETYHLGSHPPRARSEKARNPRTPLTSPPNGQAGRGLYDPTYEHDACGVAFVAHLGAPASHEVISRALWALEHLEHRGAEGADDTGDGAGLLIQIPHEFFTAEVDFELPVAGRYGVAVCFLPSDQFAREHAERLLETTVEAEGQRVLGWRDVPVESEHCGSTARAVAPCIRQIFIEAGDGVEDQDALERKLYVVRKRAEAEIAKSDIPEKSYFYIPSLSARDFEALKPACDRCCLVGDAAGLVDPVTREGIYFALHSAQFAADAIAE